MFELDFTRKEILLLFFLPALINLGIYIFVCLSFPPSRPNRLFSFFVLLLAVWQFAEGLVKISTTAETARECHRLSEIAIILLIPLGLMFFTQLTNPQRFARNNALSFLLFFPAFFFLFMVETEAIQYDIVPSGTWYWIANPVHNTPTSLLSAWTSIGAISMLLILVGYYSKNREDDIKRKQAALLLTGISLPVIVGLITEVFFPFVLKMDDIPLASCLITILSVFSMIAIRKYRLLDYSPKHHWDEIVEHMSEGILIVNTKNRVMYANKTFCNMTGYELEEIKDKPAKEFFLDPEDAPIIDEATERHKNKCNYTFEIQFKTKTGDKIWLHVRSSPYLDSRGKVIGSIGIQTNITERKKNESAARHNEFRLNQAQSVAKIGSWEMNFNTGKGVWSDEACRIYGLPVSEKYNQTYETWLEFIHPADLRYVKKEIKKANETLSNSNIKHRIIARDGVVRYIQSVARFEFNEAGFPVGLFGVCHDITEQVSVEKALNESEKNMRTFINESLMSIYFVNPESRKITFCNPALSELLGYSIDELKEMNPYDFINYPKEEVDLKVKEVIDTKTIYTGERQWKRKDGKIVNVLVNSFYHQHNGTDALYIAAQDITERKKAEEKLEASNKELELFIYKTSHDIRGPLASIMGLIKVSKYEIKDEKSLRYLDMINSAIQKLDYTLSELVKAMNIKDVTVFNEEINFKGLVEGILERFEHFPGYERLKIKEDISVTGGFLSNRSVLETMVQNLLENSIKYQNTSQPVSFLNVDISGDSNSVKITIEDNGIGIEEQYQAKIFDMYFRANNNTRGSGLGLYLVKKAVDKLNGTIKLISKPGEGSTFTVTIPAYNLYPY